jgi:hypothetical protein
MNPNLETWIDNVPDYYDMTTAYNAYGRLKQRLVLKEREIERIEQQIAMEESKPRSNEARALKLSRTSALLDERAEIQAELVMQESYVKALEYRKSMFASAAYTIKMRYEAPMGEVE